MILIAIYLYCSGEIHLGVLSLLFYFHDLNQVLVTLHWLNHFNTECSTFECTSWLFYEVWILYALVRCVNYGSTLGLANGSPYEKENFLWARSANILQSHTESFKHNVHRDMTIPHYDYCVDLMCTSFFHSVKSSCLSSKQASRSVTLQFGTDIFGKDIIFIICGSVWHCNTFGKPRSKCSWSADFQQRFHKVMD